LPERREQGFHHFFVEPGQFRNEVKIKWFMGKEAKLSNRAIWAEPTKFDQLRSKTDLQLVHLINTELNLNLRDARQALRSADIGVVAGEFYRRAKAAHARISRLLPLISGTFGDERIEMECKLAKLIGMLESLSAIGSTPTPAENEVAALARAVWKARGCAEGLADEDWYRAERALKGTAIGGRTFGETITATSRSQSVARHPA
jgi:hypothetical protein